MDITNLPKPQTLKLYKQELLYWQRRAFAFTSEFVARLPYGPENSAAV